MDVRTLIFAIALLNFSFALLVWIFNRSQHFKEPHLKLWQIAKLVCGIGYLLGGVRPFLPEPWRPWAHIGNAMQFIGIAIELTVYCGFLGLSHWRRRIAGLMVFVSLFFALVVVLGDSPHMLIVTGTAIAGVIYATMAWIMLRNYRRAPELMGVMGGLDALLAALLLSKVLIGLLFLEMVPYTSNIINVVLYATAFVAMSSNGFGFLLLTKQDDDRQLRRALDKLTEAESQQRQFIAMLSHEVRTPLAVIDATAQVLNLRLRNDPEQLPLLGRIRRGAARLSNFFTNCLTNERIDSPNFTVQPSPVALPPLVMWAKETAEILSEQHTCQVDIEPDLPPLQGDQVLLRILFMNLLTNAIKYAPAHTAITVRIGRQPHNAQRCCIAVEDQGPGIAPDELSTIFQKYQRGRGAHTTPGAGLGLALVARIAELHGGTVWAESEPGQGTRFVLDIPFTPTL